MKRITLIVFLCYWFLASSALNLDSLRGVWGNLTQHDTNRLNAMRDIAWDGYLFSQPDSAFFYAQLQYDLAQEKGLKKYMGLALNTQAVSFHIRGNYSQAITHYSRGLSLFEELNDENNIANLLNNIGNIYKKQGDYSKAMGHYTRSLKILEKLGDKRGVASSLNNLGVIYFDQGDYQQAMKYYSRSLQIENELNDNKQGMLTALNNMGVLYSKEGNYSQALENYGRGLKIAEEAGDKKGMALSLEKMGHIYRDQEHYGLALEYYNRSLVKAQEIEDKAGMSNALQSIGLIYYLQDDLQQAIVFGLSSLKQAEEVGEVLVIKAAAKTLSLVYSENGEHEKALKMHEVYIEMRDSLNSDVIEREVIRKEIQYNFEQEMLTLQKEGEKRQLISNQEKQEQRWIIFSVSLGLGLVVLFAIFLTNRVRVIRNQKRVIENQKEDLEIQKSLVDEKNKDITDSIRYARSIQKAILPEKEYGRKLLPEHFILFKPKDIVSGDFYWITENKGKVFFAVCDCTGHGVPGAFMSMIGSSLLNEVVNEKGVNTPGAIFDEVRLGFINALKQTTDDVQQKDGMDAILCSLDQNRKLEFAAAYNPLFLIRDGELIDFKADAQPVGFHLGVETPFTNQELPLEKNDVIYLLSDGFQDQFGGPKGKKFKVRKLKNLLLNIYSLPMADQFQKLTEVFDEWKGDLDQVDDVCIMGMRI